jgi:ribosomal protein S18 acetylase RimI-like enzyme
MNLKELHSFKLSDAVTFHDKLNPKLWIGVVLRPEVKDQLMTIAQDFLEELGVHDLDVKDITISGSNAAYSYTKHSDLDLHILVDMGNLPVDEVYKELFTAKKTIYNDTHDIKIHGIPVELYVQDSRQPVVSLGEYSVMHDKWLKIPTKRRSNFDQTSTKSKYEKLLGLIEIALQSKKYSKVKHIIDTIKRYRQAGLDKGGEFGPENLAYKMLRSQGYITKLYELRDKLHSEKLSFETMYQNIDEDVAEEHLAEIERMPGNEYTGGKKSLRIGYGDKKIKKLPGTNAFVYSTEANDMVNGIIIKLWDSANIAPKPVKMPKEDAYEFSWRLKDWERNYSEDGPGVLIGKLTLENANRFPLKGALQVSTITVDEDYRGQGVAKSMYGIALSILQRPLLAGSSQTPGGRRNWLSLASIPGVDIKGYVMINEARFDNPEWAEKDIDTIMGKLGGQYIGPSKPPGIHYFAFDVVPGSGELAPAVKTELSKIYDEHGSRTGLYAIWSGAVNEQGVAEEYNTMQFAAEKTPAINPYGGRKDNQYRGSMSEASGYIPSEKQKNDPRFKTALTVDVHPDTIKKNAKAFYWNTSRAGIPPTAKANGKIS